MIRPLMFGLISWLCLGSGHRVIQQKFPNGSDHALFTQVLADHVTAGVVDYKAIKADARFPQYIALLQKANANTLTGNDKLAFWINAYNAFTIQYVLERYPIKSLMRDLPDAPAGSAFKTRFIEMNGLKYSLDDIEHNIVRPVGDPRIHFALVCGAKSCPPLRSEAYTGDRLNEQLDEQGRIFMSQTDKNRFDFARNEIHVSRVFDWFKDDFRKDGKTELEFMSEFLPEDMARQLLASGAKLKVKYTEYDWDLNE